MVTSFGRARLARVRARVRAASLPPSYTIIRDVTRLATGGSIDRAGRFRDAAFGLAALTIEAHGQLVRDSGLSPRFLGQMTSVMGSSPAHFCGSPKPPFGACGRDHGAHVPRISRPPPSRFVLSVPVVTSFGWARLARALDQPGRSFYGRFFRS